MSGIRKKHFQRLSLWETFLPGLVGNKNGHKAAAGILGQDGWLVPGEWIYPWPQVLWGFSKYKKKPVKKLKTCYGHFINYG